MNIHERINAIMADLRGVEKSSRNQHQNYAYAGHEALNEALRPYFVREKIVQTVNVSDVRIEGGTLIMMVTIRWACADDPASFVEQIMAGIQPTTAKSGIPQAQQVGQALSYAVKNAQFKAFQLTDSNEPDSDSQDQQLSDKREPVAPADPGLKARAIEVLATFGTVVGPHELEAHKSYWVKPENWATIREYPGIRDQLKAAYLKAKARIEAQK